MKADHRKQLEKNELADRLSRWWQGTGEAKKSATVWVVIGAIALIAVLVFAWRYYSDLNQRNRAQVWKRIEQATSAADLEAIIDENRGTAVGRAAKAQLARLSLNEGLAKMASELQRPAALGQVEKARSLYTALMTDAKGDAILQGEATFGAAKAEEALVAVPKSDNASESRGSLDRALELYEETAQKYGNSPQGKEAAERAKDIRANKAQIQQFYEELNKRYAKFENPLGPSDGKPNQPPPLTIPGEPPPKTTAKPATTPARPLEAPPGDSKPPATRPAAPGNNPLPPPPGDSKSKDTRPADAKPGDPKPAPPLVPPQKDPAQPPLKPDPAKSGDKSEKKPDRPEKK